MSRRRRKGRYTMGHSRRKMHRGKRLRSYGSQRGGIRL